MTKIAHQAGRQIALTLSDSFCVIRYLQEFQELVREHVDILFANEGEIKALWQTESYEEAVAITRQSCELAALTRSEKGSVVVSGDEVHVVDAEPVEHLVDTTGAGDLYAAGFLVGYTQNRDLATCARMGGIAAAEIISHVGPRPEHNLQALIAASLG